MKLSDAVNSFCARPRLKARLNQDITLSDGYTFKKGTVSELLIDRGGAGFHFEADNTACVVGRDEIEFI